MADPDLWPARNHRWKIDGWTVGWQDSRMDGQTDRQVRKCLFMSTDSVLGAWEMPINSLPRSSEILLSEWGWLIDWLIDSISYIDGMRSIFCPPGKHLTDLNEQAWVCHLSGRLCLYLVHFTLLLAPPPPGLSTPLNHWVQSLDFSAIFLHFATC